MNKTILIGTNNKFSIKANRWLFGLAGLLFLINGAVGFYRHPEGFLSFVLGILMVFGGFFLSAYGLLGFSKKSRFALKVKVDDESIEIKYNLMKPPMQLSWSDVQAITIASHEVGFDQGKATKIFSYRSNTAVSNDIKETIKTAALEKNIPVTSK